MDRAILGALSLEDQISLLSGASFWLTVPVPEAGVPAVKVSDGPNGARGGGALVGGVSAACFPAGIGLAATWDTALVEEVGNALAEEAQSKGARALLAPTVNLHRGALNGRNFECYSEDPFLTSRLGVAYVRGLQEQGVSAVIKHFVGNDSEFQRNTISSEISERALRELYLVPFEVAVKEAKVWAVMSSYNKVAGVYASDNHRLLTEILRDEWDFEGIVMSDWFGTYSTAPAVNAGLDLEMPGPARYRGEKLLEAVESGAVDRESVERSAERLRHWFERLNAFENPDIPEEQALNKRAHRLLIRRAGAEGAVLLKNDGVLPLDRDALKRVAVIGPNARVAQIMGGGSAQVNAHYRVSPYDGLIAAFGEDKLGYELGCTNHKMLPLLGEALTAPLRAEYFNSPDLSGDVVYKTTQAEGQLMWLDAIGHGVDQGNFSVRFSGTFTVGKAGDYHVDIVSAGFSRLFIDDALRLDNWEGWEPGDSYFGSGSAPKTGRVTLSAGEHTLRLEYAPKGGAFGISAWRIGMFKPLGEDALGRAAALAAESDVAIVCVGLNGEWETEGNDRADMELVGRQNELVSRVAAANPNTVVLLQTGSPVTMPWLEEVAAVVQLWYPGQECGNAAADVLVGKVNPSGKLPQTFPAQLSDSPVMDGDPSTYPGENGQVFYREGIFIGYRHFEREGLRPLFPFGFGLSYTTFDYGEVSLGADSIAPGGSLSVRVPVTNSGAREGKEVVQLYVRDVSSSLPRPKKELKGFVKLTLEPGETKEAEFTLDMRSLAYFDDGQKAWVAEAGAFEVRVGAASDDTRGTATFALTETWTERVG